MFIIKLGAEALNKLEEQLTESSVIRKSVNGSNLYSCEGKIESSILYNLLSNDEVSTKPQSLLFPINRVTKFDEILPPRANTISYSTKPYYNPLNIAPRPYSAPQSNSELTHPIIRKRKQSTDNCSEFDELKPISFNKNCKISSKSSVDSHSMSCSTDSGAEEAMDLSQTTDHLCVVLNDGKFVVDSWLFKTASLINPTNNQINNNLAELTPVIRLHLLHSSWHRIIITYLFQHLSKSSCNISVELWRFLQSVTGITNQSALNKKKMSCMYKNLVDELNVILYQIKKLNLDDVSMNFLRIGLLLTGNHDDNNQKNLKLIELFIRSKIDCSESDWPIISDLIENLLRLNSVIIETIFYSHLENSVENTIDQLCSN